MAQAYDAKLPKEDSCNYTSFPVILPDLKLNKEKREEIETLLANHPRKDYADYPVATDDEQIIHVEGNVSNPWKTFLDHQDDLIKIKLYNQEHHACIQHI